MIRAWSCHLSCGARDEERIERANVTRFARWVEETRGLELPDYAALWHWSVHDLDGFWGAVWEHFGVRSTTPVGPVLGAREMPGAVWFPGTRLNYAEHVLRGHDPDAIAIRHASELRPLSALSWADLAERTARIAAGLRALGVGEGDRVVAYLPNIPEAVAAFLACASVGAIWSSCSPDFGARSVVDRFAQIEPKVLLAVDGYRYAGRDFDRLETLAGVQSELPTLEHTVVLGYLDPEPRLAALRSATGWASWRRSAPERSSPSQTFRSSTRCGCSTAPARPVCRKRSCTGTAASCSRR